MLHLFKIIILILCRSFALIGVAVYFLAVAGGVFYKIL